MDISPTPEEPEHCPTCGASVRRADHFCSVCGQNLPWTPLAGDQAQLPIEQPAHLTRYSATGEIVQDYVLDKREITIGRAEANDILLSLDSLASRHHVTIHHEQGEYLLRDEGSENGTMLNGALLPELTPQILREGDQVSMGEYTFVFSQERGAYQKQPIETVRESAPVLPSLQNTPSDPSSQQQEIAAAPNEQAELPQEQPDKEPSLVRKVIGISLLTPILLLMLIIASFPFWLCVIVSPGLVITLYHSVRDLVHLPMSAAEIQAITPIVVIICYSLAGLLVIAILVHMFRVLYSNEHKTGT